jgi:hypothetical protein
VNTTAKNFGCPDSLLESFGWWHPVVRPAQPTLGGLVPVCSEPARSFGAIGPEGGAQLAEARGGIERV